MSLRLYLDENVEQSIVAGLRLRGVDVLSVREDGMNGRIDLDILNRAKATERVVFTRDEDFLILASEWQSQGISFPGIVYGHSQRASIGECIADLEIISTLLEPSEVENQVLYIPM
jgi:hypothetical protein